MFFDTDSFVYDNDSNSTDSLSPQSMTKREYDNAVSVNLHVDAGPGCGGIAWPAADVRLPFPAFALLFALLCQYIRQVLAQYIIRRYSSQLNRMSVLELGSGTGLVGLVAASLGATVHITDQLCVHPPTTSPFSISSSIF